MWQRRCERGEGPTRLSLERNSLTSSLRWSLMSAPSPPGRRHRVSAAGGTERDKPPSLHIVRSMGLTEANLQAGSEWCNTHVLISQWRNQLGDAGYFGLPVVGGMDAAGFGAQESGWAVPGRG